MTELSRNKLRLQRKKRIRSRISGTGKLPRLSVFRSLKGICAQVINDDNGTTLASAQLSEIKGRNDIAGARKTGNLIAQKCLKKKITRAVFDRAGYKYHGKVKALAEGAREGGLEF